MPPPSGLQATNRQLAALTSLRVLHENYKLWASYALHRPAAAKSAGFVSPPTAARAPAAR